MTRSRIVLFAVLVAGIAAGIGLDRTLLVAQQSGLTRTVLQRVDDPGSPKHEAVMAAVELQPGASAGAHRHPGVEIGYVLEGSVVIEHAGRPAATKKAGEYFQIDSNAVHNARNVTKTPMKLLAIYMVEKGKPLAEPVK
jgi:quercetin dioxygenase-like cupin family protein